MGTSTQVGARWGIALRRRYRDSALRRSRRGTIAVLFALSAAVVVSSVGAGIDLMRIYASQQKLSEIAALTCQYASRPSILQTATSSLTQAGSTLTYVTKVTGFMTSTWVSQNIPTGQTSTNPFTAIANGAADVTLGTNVPTTFMRMLGVSALPVRATSHCYDSPASITQVIANGNSPYLVQEGFESAPCGSNWCAVLPNGTVGTSPAPTSAFPSSPSYYGSHGSSWYVVGYCLETDQVGVINGAVPEGSYAAELDCDNGSGTAGNSSISANTYMEAGNYELRWFYRSRVPYPDYDPAYICGSSVADTSWANDANNDYWYVSAIGVGALRTNQVNVYLDQPLANGAPPLHTTLDGAVQLAGSAMIDSCVYSAAWVERSVRIKVTTPGYYWLSFAADGHNDSYGGQIDNIRLCAGTCPGTPQDNFPSASYNPNFPGGTLNPTTSMSMPDWLNPNGYNKGLFTETFESPAYTTTNATYNWNTNQSLNASTGTSGTSASGWPNLAASGWATAPLNQIEYILKPDWEISNFPALGSQYVDLFGQTTQSGYSGYSRVISRPFLLVPGFYNISYYYLSNFDFTGFNGPYCLSWSGTAGPSAGALNAINYYNTASNGVSKPGRYFVTSSNSGSQPAAMNTLGVFIANGQLASTPIGGGAVNAVTSWTNPDSNLADIPPATTTSTTATVPPDAISANSYTPSPATALLDLCTYSGLPVARSINFEIQKTGFYWLTFSTRIAYPAWTNAGGAIDNVVLTALGSPAMISPPSSYVPVPVGAPQAGATQSATGYFIVADPLTFPAPAQ